MAGRKRIQRRRGNGRRTLPTSDYDEDSLYYERIANNAPITPARRFAAARRAQEETLELKHTEG